MSLVNMGINNCIWVIILWSVEKCATIITINFIQLPKMTWNKYQNMHLFNSVIPKNKKEENINLSMEPDKNKYEDNNIIDFKIKL